MIVTNRIMRSKILQFTILFLILCCIYAFYNLGSASKISGLNGSLERNEQASIDEKSKQKKKTLLSVSKSDTNKAAKAEKPVDVMITFTKAEQNSNLQTKFRTTVKSLFRFASIPINLYILGDPESEKIAKNILSEVADSQKYTVSSLVRSC